MDHTPGLPPAAFSDSAELFLPSGVGREPLVAVARALAGFNRDQLGSAIEMLLALMDVADAPLDPDEPAFDVQVTDSLPGDSGDHEKGGDEDGINTALWAATGYGPAAPSAIPTPSTTAGRKGGTDRGAVQTGVKVPVVGSFFILRRIRPSSTHALTGEAAGP